MSIGYSSFKRLVPNRLKVLYRQRSDYFSFLLEPIDHLAATINGKGFYPPLRLRKWSGPLSTFETASATTIAFLWSTCGLKPEDRVLDIGCGCGAIARLLVGFFNGSGGYVGVDVHGASIEWAREWARRNIEAKDSRFRFTAVDVANLQYNPRGQLDPTAYKLPLPDESFDVILLKSVFTHMRPQQVDNYLGEMARLLSKKGHCLMTFFLLSPKRDALISRGASPRFELGDGEWRYDDADVPERAIAYREEYVSSLMSRHGLELAFPVLYGYQDTLVIRRLEGGS